MIQFEIPEAWETTYKKLLHLMVQYGIAGLKDCNNHKTDRNSRIIDCWNVFQSACCAKSITEYESTGDVLFNYVVVEIDRLFKDEVPEELLNAYDKSLVEELTELRARVAELEEELDED